MASLRCDTRRCTTGKVIRFRVVRGRRVCAEHRSGLEFGLKRRQRKVAHRATCCKSTRPVPLLFRTTMRQRGRKQSWPKFLQEALPEMARGWLEDHQPRTDSGAHSMRGEP